MSGKRDLPDGAPMSFSERNIITELLSNAVILVLFIRTLTARHATGAFDGPDGMMIWARMVLWMIPAAIVAGIVVTLLFTAAHRLITGEPHDTLMDERDRLIAGLGWKVTMIVTATGFVACLGALAAGLAVFIVLNLMLASFAAGDTAGNLAKFFAYRRGG